MTQQDWIDTYVEREEVHDCDEHLVRTTVPNTFECSVCKALCNRLGDYS